MATTTGMRRPLRRALAAAAVAASLLLAGCGGEEPPPPPDVDSELKLEPATTTDAAGEGTPIVLYLAASDLPRLDEVEMTPSPRRHPVSALRDQLNTTGDKRMAVEYLAETQPVHGAAPARTSVELDL